MTVQKAKTVDDLIEYCEENNILQRTFIDFKSSKKISSKISFKTSKSGKNYRIEQHNLSDNEPNGYKTNNGFIRITLV